MKKSGKTMIIMLTWMLMLCLCPLSAQARIKLNKTKKIAVTGKLFYLKVKNTKKKVRWRSSNTEVAVVKAISRNKAVVLAKSPGRALILAKVKSKKKILRCKVLVLDNPNPTEENPNVSLDVTPPEENGSDLEILHTVTKLDFPRWIQSFALDSKYYYFIQMTSANTGNLRITRVKYSGLGRYMKDHMDLINFGHGTNIDCSTYNGVTYLWTGSMAGRGSDVSTAISCFPYVRNGRLVNHAAITYRIPYKGSGAYVSNVYPAVNEKENRLMVRFTNRGKQYFQTYKLYAGTAIDVTKPLRCKVCSLPKADFQGFDYYKSQIKTIEGSPSKVFLAGYDRNRTYYPTVIRTYKLKGSSVKKKTIIGAAKLLFREPEGIKVLPGGKTIIMFVSHTLTDQSCNIYQVK